MLRREPQKFIAATIPALFNPERRQHLAKAIEEAKAEAEKTDPGSAAVCSLAMKTRPDHTGILKKFSGRIWYVGGDADPLFSKEQVNAETALLPPDHVFMIPGCGHMSYAEDPAAARKVMERVIAGF